jgi:uncharacterized protein (TIGR02391 family)
MMPTLFDLLPDASAVLALEPEELGGLALELLLNESRGETSKAHPSNFTNNASLGGFPDKNLDELGYAMAEAWNWLVREGLLASKPGDSFGWYFVTRRGKQLKNRLGVAEYRKSLLLPRDMLHPKILEACWPPYFRGEYDTAVFKAFRELEIGIREAGALAAEDVGTHLARKAFGDEGPLCDKSTPSAERQALHQMMAGAIGSYKNPHSHRRVAVDATEAAEILILASHLLKIVDKRWLSSVLG